MNDTIFNERGLLRDDLENVHVAPERQGVFDALVRAVRGAEAAEEDVRHIESIVADAVKYRDHVAASMPRSTPLDEVRAMAAHDDDQRRLRHGLLPMPRNVGEGALADGVRGDPPSSRAALVPPQEALRLADAALDLARHELRQSRDALARARDTVSKTLAAYNRATPSITAEQNTRDWITSNNAARAERAAARYVPTVTETAKAMGGGGHNVRRGGGAAYRRGPGGTRAFTQAQAAELNAARIREGRAKLPSER